MQTFRVTVPTTTDVERIAGMQNPALRNLSITACYHELSAAMHARLGAAANWCTFATWASRQAGVTIRGEDLPVAFEQRVSAHVRLLAQAAERYSADVARNVRVIRDIIARQRPLQRSADAVARGNLKVFAEIGREFARYLADGEPPREPPRLHQAFRAYADALQTSDAVRRSQLVYYANLLIGYHEQTRLQPEIREALDSARDELMRMRPLLLKHLLPGWWLRMRTALARMIGRKMPIDVMIDQFIDNVCDELREIVTAELMTLRLPTGNLRLGHDMPATYPDPLRHLDYTPLTELLASRDIAASAPRRDERDWSDFPYRMYFIAKLFRAWQEQPELLQAPYTPAQLADLHAGRLPAPPL
jgi:hypothetical protein